MKTTSRFLLAAFAAALLPFSSSAQDEVVSVAAKGYGGTVEAARRNAGRAAIEQVVGSLVDAETLVENDDVVRDKVLAYSAGIIESIEVVGDPAKDDEGLWRVNVLAKVRKTQIVERLRAENVAITIGDDLTKLVDQNRSKADQEKAALEMIQKAFVEWPYCLFVAKPAREEGKVKLFSHHRSSSLGWQ